MDDGLLVAGKQAERHTFDRDMRRGRTLSFQDASIAAVCIAYGCTLVTENARDFPMPFQLYPLSQKAT